MDLLEVLKATLIGIVQGVTEWLPVSSTGHMLLLQELLRLRVSPAFWELFLVVIQLASVLAVLGLYRHRLWPFARGAGRDFERVTLWLRILLALLPSAVLGFLLDDWLTAHLYNPPTVAAALLAYGLLFLLPLGSGEERPLRGDRLPRSTALGVGFFQCLALIPGTSRSGATILGALLLGLGRLEAAEFSFFLAIPTMLGASLLKTGKALFQGFRITGTELWILVAGCLAAWAVSRAVVRALLHYVRSHSFRIFGVYRILLGAAILIRYLRK